MTQCPNCLQDQEIACVCDVFGMACNGIVPEHASNGVRVLRIAIKNVRIFGSHAISFAPSINEIIGCNGRGKTTILEAIFLLITGSSFRASSLKELVAHNARDFCVDLTFVKEGIESDLKCVFKDSEKVFFYNGNVCSGKSLIGLLHGVIATSQDVFLIQGAPSFRRKFLDVQIAQADPLYVHHLSRYGKALQQRNTLLRDKGSQVSPTIRIWEKELAASGAYILQERRKTLRVLNASLKLFFTDFSAGFLENIHMKDLASCPRSDDLESLKLFFEQEYEKKRHYELLCGQTVVGPHRHDFAIEVNGRLFRDFASEGELKVLAIALRFAEWQALYQRTQIKPLFLADDIGAHLDADRLKSVLRIFENLGQVIITGQRAMHTQAECLHRL